MSVNRLLLRRMLVAMLNNGEEAPYPTLAGANVYDSKIDSLNVVDDAAEPIISVYTDKDSGFNYNPNQVEDRVIEIIIELRIASVNNEGVAIPITDYYLEIQLDMLEQQIKSCIKNSANPFTEIFQKFVIHIDGWNSQRLASEQGGLKYAARQIQFNATICDDDDIPVEVIDHQDNVDAILARFEPLNANGHLTLTLNYLKTKIITPSDDFDALEILKITSNGVDSSTEL